MVKYGSETFMEARKNLEGIKTGSKDEDFDIRRSHDQDMTEITKEQIFLSVFAIWRIMITVQ